MKKEIYINGVPVTYVLTRKRVKNVNLRVKSDGIVYASANNAVSVDFIENFIIKNGSRILGFIEKTKEKNRNNPADCRYEDGDKARYLGKVYTVLIKNGSENKVETEKDLFVVTLKDAEDEALKLKTIEKWYKSRIKEAFSKVNEETAEKFKELGIPKADIRTRKMVSRWGSCKISEGLITINTRLIFYPYECIEAVFIHEYAHFICYYHNKEFYSLVNKMMPEYKKWDIVLKDSLWG